MGKCFIMAAASRTEQMPQADAWRLLQSGGCVTLVGAPQEPVVGIDLAGWSVTDECMGFKMVPPGPHFISVSCVTFPECMFTNQILLERADLAKIWPQKQVGLSLLRKALFLCTCGVMKKSSTCRKDTLL